MPPPNLQAPWTIYGLNWSCRPDRPYRLAVGSFVEEYNNCVEILQLNEKKGEFERKAIFDHPYPTTKIMWAPDKKGGMEDLLATTGDYLRIWKVEDDGSVKLRVLLNNNKTSPYCAPLTSVDWCETDPTTMGTSSIDTTCTMWNIETNQAKTQLIAHDKEVYDIVFSPAKDVFASAGADGSVRMFDLRSLEHSTILYESPQQSPLLRISWNKMDHNYLATLQADGTSVVVLDIRAASVPVAELKAHTQPANAIGWAPHSSCHLASAGDDKTVFIWDLTAMPKPITDPFLTYQAEAEINNMAWSSLHADWVALAFGNTLKAVKV